MPVDKSKSNSGKMASKDAFRVLGISRNASVDEIDDAFKSKLADLQKKYASKPERLVEESSALYAAYRSAFLAKGGSEDQMLPLTLTGPDEMLNVFGIPDVPQSLKVQMHSQAHYKDGNLVKKESSRTESFINKDGKRETKVFENGKLVRHTIDGQNQLK